MALGPHQRWILDLIGPDGWGAMTESDIIGEAEGAGISRQRIQSALAALVSRDQVEVVPRLGARPLYRLPG